MPVLKRKSYKSRTRRPVFICRRTYKHRVQSITPSKKSHLIRVFMEMLNMVKLYHWKTHSYSEHKSTDELYEHLGENIDKFVEVLMGKDQKRIHMMESRIQLVDTKNTKEFKTRILQYRTFFTDMDMYLDSRRDSDLLSIRDDILADINQFLYLLSMNK